MALRLTCMKVVMVRAGGNCKNYQSHTGLESYLGDRKPKLNT